MICNKYVMIKKTIKCVEYPMNMWITLYPPSLLKPRDYHTPITWEPLKDKGVMEGESKDFNTILGWKPWSFRALL